LIMHFSNGKRQLTGQKVLLEDMLHGYHFKKLKWISKFEKFQKIWILTITYSTSLQSLNAK
jgi:hypothetical protein